MMKISVKLLSTYREKLPEGTKGNTYPLEIPEHYGVEEVLKMFDIPYDLSSIVLINGCSPEDDQKLRDGDSVCVFSAIAGG